MLIYIKFEKRKIMPFKTKGQKLAASQRRFTVSSAQVISYGFGGSEKVKNKQSFSSNKQSFSANKNLSFAQNLDSRDARIKQSFSSNKKIAAEDGDKNLPIENFAYLRHDLVKTIFMASLIIALQLVLALTQTDVYEFLSSGLTLH